MFRKLEFWIIAVVFMCLCGLATLGTGLVGLSYLQSRKEVSRSAQSKDNILAEAKTKIATNLHLRTSGPVDDNHDDGDAVMGSIMHITRDDPVTDPALFLIVPGYNIDVEYAGRMYFVTDRYDGKASVSEGAALAISLYEADTLRIFVGPENQTPEGFVFWTEAEGWFLLKDWKYSEEPIRPEGLVCSEGKFIGTTDTKREITAGENEVLYGQSWTISNPGYVVHFQVRPGETLTVPAGWEGTYWVWSGNLKVGETDLQKRLIQATFKEVVDRDDIKGVQLLIVGDLPADIDPNFTQFEFNNETVTWDSQADGWSN